ncbi:9229_t:CDS:2 [Ambispora leptoticha]|uniref:9229_t:CDS:1 n=1 Tax=Ambispora leptoticha TaxID=144679 RepID=A0A9N9FBI8_9GLOM|nr:9229_t:CDS:2 [Ambispora leptoticha]
MFENVFAKKFQDIYSKNLLDTFMQTRLNANYTEGTCKGTSEKTKQII